MLAVQKIIEAYLGIPHNSVVRIWCSKKTGEVDEVGEYDAIEDALDASKNEFAEFCDTCEEACGEPPTCLYSQAEFIVSDSALLAVLTFRKPTSDDESLYPVLVVERDGAKEEFTVEAVSSASLSSLPV